jgi:uncharacterized protein (TIGR02271 family)
MTGAHRGDGSDAEESSVEGSDANTTSADGGAETVRHEERLEVGTTVEEVGSVHVRKQVESHPVEYSVPRDVEHVDTNERITAVEGDSGEVEVLDDGSVSIPVFEEVLVVTKRLVVRERLIVRKRTVVDEYKLQTELRRENVTVDVDDEVTLIDDGVNGAGEGVAGDKTRAFDPDLVRDDGDGTRQV